MLRLRTLTLIAVASLLVSGEARAQTVVSRARLGNAIEDITFVSNGRLADHLAFMNGYELYVAPLHPKGGPSGPATQTKLFDVRSTAIPGGPRGLAYIPSQKLFVFSQVNAPTLYLVDENGVFRGTRTIVPSPPSPIYLEGMDYVPRSSHFYPDHLVLAANTTDGSAASRIEVLRLDGTVEAEIIPSPFGLQPDGSYAFDPAYSLLSIAYQGPDRLLVNVNDLTNNIWALDFNGNVIGGGPAYAGTPGPGHFEGIAELPDGGIVETDFETGRTLFFDRNLGRVPALDRTYSVGVGVSVPYGLAWNTDTNSHLLMTPAQGPSWLYLGLASVPVSLDSAASVPFVPSSGLRNCCLTYLPNDHRVATWARRGILGVPHNFIRLYDPSTGLSVSEVDTPALGTDPPRALDYIPPTDQFAAVFTGGPPVVKIASRTGALVRTINIGATGLTSPSSVAYFDPTDGSGGRLLLVQALNAAVTDLDGNAVLTFNIREKLNLLVPVDVSAITTGPQAGALAIVDRDNSELVVFTLP